MFNRQAVQKVQIPPHFPKTSYELFCSVNNTKTPFICTDCTEPETQSFDFAGVLQ